MLPTKDLRPPVIGPSPEKVTARIVGALFLTAIAAYATGNGLIQSVSRGDYLASVSLHGMQVRLGVLLMLLNSGVVVAIGVLMFPVLKKHGEPMALGYVATRIIESAILIVGSTRLLSLITLSAEYTKGGATEARYFRALGSLAIRGHYFSYQIAMAVLGAGSVGFCLLLYRSKMIPRFISAWGVIGYAALMAGALCEISGLGVGLALSIPGGLFEIALPLWLFARGFRPAAVPS